MPYRNSLSLFLLLLIGFAQSSHGQAYKSPSKTFLAANRSSSQSIGIFRPKSPAPKIFGKSAIVIEAKTGSTLYSKYADQKRAVASTQKLMTALLSLEKGHMHESVRVASTDTNVEPSKIYIQAGQLYRKSDLIATLLVRSGNDVARCLARHHSGSQKSFSYAMNQKAKSLGMNNSNFLNPHGLTQSGQYSTARDMAKLARVAYFHRTIRSITSLKKLPFRFANGKRKTFNNTNKLLSKSPYCNGLKTGYTRASGNCLISSGKNGSREVIIVVLGSNSGNIWKDSEKLMHWALGI